MIYPKSSGEHDYLVAHISKIIILNITNSRGRLKIKHLFFLIEIIIEVAWIKYVIYYKLQYLLRSNIHQNKKNLFKIYCFNDQRIFFQLQTTYSNCIAFVFYGNLRTWIKYRASPRLRLVFWEMWISKLKSMQTIGNWSGSNMTTNYRIIPMNLRSSVLMWVVR